MQALDKIDADGVGQTAGRMLGVEDLLQRDVGSGLNLEIAPRLVDIEFVGQRPLNVSWPGVVPLDQVGVIAIHDPHQVRQAGGCSGVEAGAKLAGRGGQLRQEIQQLSSRLVN